jgi:hypothetical protein
LLGVEPSINGEATVTVDATESVDASPCRSRRATTPRRAKAATRARTDDAAGGGARVFACSLGELATDAALRCCGSGVRRGDKRGAYDGLAAVQLITRLRDDGT